MDKTVIEMTKVYVFENKGRIASVYGIGSYIKALGNALHDSDLQICFIHINADVQRFTEQVEDNISHWHIPCPKNIFKDEEKNRNMYAKNVVFILRKYIDQTENLIFHLNNIEYKTLANSLKESFDCKIVLAIHYLPWCFELMGNVSLLRKISGKQESKLDQCGIRVKKSLAEEKEMLQAVDKVLCLSKHTAGILRNIYKVKKQHIAVIYNGLTDGRPVQDKEALRRKYHIPDIPIILFAGRLDDIKGLKYALQAFKIVLKTIPCHFIIAGNGIFDHYLKECEDIWIHVTWTGLIDKEKLDEFYSLADFGVMPSFHEQCSYVAIEMMMNGLPLIASTSTGLREMVEDGVSGLHIPVIETLDNAQIDIGLLAEKMLYLLQHPDERQRMGLNARKRYENLYSQDIYEKNMLNFYQSLYCI
jgi:glycosyltransferase